MSEPNGSANSPIVVGNLSIKAPQIEPSYPIPCAEWEYLKNQLKRAEGPPWMLQVLGSVLLGAALAELGTIVVGAIPNDPPKLLAYAWAFVVAAGISGTACLVVAVLRQGDLDRAGEAVVGHMGLIEDRFRVK